jgi:hypothetical protein
MELIKLNDRLAASTKIKKGEIAYELIWIKKEVQSIKEKYESIVWAEGQEAVAKKDMAEINKVKDFVDNFRKTN